MDPKFLVIEIDSKEQAVQLVQVMLDQGFARLMLLDDLGKHPTFAKSKQDITRDTASSPIPTPSASPKHSQDYFQVEKKVMFPTLSNSVASSSRSGTFKKESDVVAIEDEEAVEEDEVIPQNAKRGTKRSYDQEAEDPDYREQLMSMLCGEPEIVPIEVNSANDEQTPSTSEGPKKRVKITEHHECKVCGVRVKTPRSGRWNLQMHVIALHSVGRNYRCKECEYVDYRKSTMRKHTVTQHGKDIPPLNVVNDEMRKEWHDAMVKCFPEFAHRTGFLKD